MQRLTSIFTLCLYVVLTIGLSLHTHYCMGREVGHSLLSLNCDPPCGKPCCQDTVTSLRLAEEHVVSDGTISLHAPAVSPWDCPPAPAFVEDAARQTDGAYRRYSSSPPLPPAVPRYVRFLSLIYYA
jgi:hypothetical protein